MNKKVFNKSGIAIDFGATKVSSSKIIKGKFKQNNTEKTLAFKNNKTYISQIENIIQNQIDTNTKKIGIAITGRVDNKGNWYAVNKNNLGSFKIPLKKIFNNKFKVEIKIMNDASAACFGESIYGKGRKFKRVGYITVSTGIGVGITIEKKPFISDSGLAGHLGFLTSSLGKMKCGSGRTGTFESIASGKAMSKIASQKGYKNKTAKEIFDNYFQNKKWAKEIVNLSAKSVSELCANLKAIYDIDVIIFGGSIGMAKGYIQLVKKNLKKEPKLFQVRLIKSSLGIKAAKMGVLI